MKERPHRLRSWQEKIREDANAGLSPAEIKEKQALQEKLRNPLYLPTHEEITRAFRSNKPLSGEWHIFCEDKQNPIFEFLNEEFIDVFGDYLIQRIEGLDVSGDKPVTVLEVGAGNGRLIHFLGKKLEVKAPGKVKIVATDSGEWKLKNVFPVENMAHKEALQKYKPQIVIFSWMPYTEDSSADFRATDSVQEYLLIGETDGGCCGDEWLTWGSGSSGEETKGKPPYEVDGFERFDIKDVSKQQICRTDWPGHNHHSSTVSFRRKK